MIDDLQIIQDCLAGDIQSFRGLVQKYQRSLISTAYRFLNDWDDAKDAAQVAFIKSYQSLDRFDQTRNFSTWIHKILVNTCLDRLKSAHHKYRTSWDNVNPTGNTSDALQNIATKDLLKKVLSRLPVKRRRAFILVELEGFSGPEAAEILGCSESTVRVTVMKARQQLRKIYASFTEAKQRARKT